MQKQNTLTPRLARIQSGLTWRALAAKAKVSLSTIKRIEDSGCWPSNRNTCAAYRSALGLPDLETVK
jgi:hypothetical protein